MCRLAVATICVRCINVIGLTTSTIFKMPKYDFRYSVSQRIPPNTLLEWTGSVVGWYGLLAPEIMEVLEASPSKPSGSSVVLMMTVVVGRSWTSLGRANHYADKPASDPPRGRRLRFRKHTLSRAAWTWMEERKAGGPLFMATRRAALQTPDWDPVFFKCNLAVSS